MTTAKNRMRQHIINSLLRLSCSRPLVAISVTDVCREAKISRQTFYSYFKDKYDVAQYYLQQLLKDNFSRLGTEIGWLEAYGNEFANIESALRQYPNALTNLFNNPSDYNSVVNSASRTAAEDFRECFQKRYGSQPKGLVAFQINAFAREASLVSTDWIKSNCAIPAEDFTAMFITLIPHALFDALDIKNEETCQPYSLAPHCS